MTDDKAAHDLDLAPRSAALAPYGARIAARRIREGDEAASADSCGPRQDFARRRASGAARLAARRILAGLGLDPSAPLPSLPSGAPQWPDGALGALAHDDSFALAVAARRGGLLVGIGVDVEPAEPLPADVAGFVLSAAERREAAGDRVAERLVFVAKEAVYKAIHPLDGTALEYADIETRLGEGRATLRDGRRLELLTFSGERLVAVALALASESRGRT